MVGVPPLAWWAAGPSSRMYWRMFSRWSQRMRAGPRSREIRRAMTMATAPRKVM